MSIQYYVTMHPLIGFYANRHQRQMSAAGRMGDRQMTQRGIPHPDDLPFSGARAIPIDEWSSG